MSNETLDYSFSVLEKKNGNIGKYHLNGNKGDYYEKSGQIRNNNSQMRTNKNIRDTRMFIIPPDTNKYAYINTIILRKKSNPLDIDAKIYLTKRIQEIIDEARTLLSYEDDWDGNGAMATDNSTFEIAVRTLLKISEKLIDDNYSIEVPFIDLTVNGGISLKWENKKAQLFIIFEKGETQFAYFYGESKNKEIPSCYKSGINLKSENVDGVLLAWIKDNLSKHGQFINR